MQAIARVNRVFLDKPGGLIVDYIGIGTSLKQALNFYAESGGKGMPAENQIRATEIMIEKLEVVRQMLHGFDYRDLVFTSDEEDINRYMLQPGDLLFNRTNSAEWVGKTSIYRGDMPCIYAGYLIRMRTHINAEYLNAVMNSGYAKNYCNSVKTDGVNQSNINAQKLGAFLVPIPPQNEQLRIDAFIVKVLPLVQTISQNKTDIASLLSFSKAKILDLAIRGKLVPQDPNDEPASVLLERIRAEKEALIKQGIIKQDKRESVIFRGEDNSYYEKIGNKITCIDDFLPFDIPDTWTWARLKNIGDVIGGGTPKTNNPNYWDGEIPWVTPADLSGYENMYLAQGSRFITELGLKESSAQLLPKDSVLFSSRAPIGYIAIAENAIATNQGFKSVSPYISGMSEYLYYCLRRCTNDIIQRASGTTFKEISGSEMSETLVPISSLNEQKKIVNRISDLFAVINNVEASLN